MTRLVAAAVALLVIGGHAAPTADVADIVPTTSPLEADDACLADGSGEGCSVGLLQVKGGVRAHAAGEVNATSRTKLTPPCCLIQAEGTCMDTVTGALDCNVDMETCLGPSCNSGYDRAWGSVDTPGVVGEGQYCAGGTYNTYPDCASPLVCTAPSNGGIGGYWSCEPPTCVAQGESCGGPGMMDQTCCGGGECVNLLGGNGKTCAPPPSPSPQCVPSGGSCGGPGMMDLTCCDGGQCTQLLGGNGKSCVA